MKKQVARLTARVEAQARLLDSRASNNPQSPAVTSASTVAAAAALSDDDENLNDTEGTPAAAAAEDCPSYMRPTKASSARQNTTDSLTAVRKPPSLTSSTTWFGRERFRYEDGQLIGPLRDPPSVTSDPILSDFLMRGEPEDVGERSADDPFASLGESEPVPCAASTEDTSGYRNWIDKSPLVLYFEDDERALEFVQTAFNLAREALWHYTREHHPDLFRRWHWSPMFIQASWKELDDATKGFTRAPELWLVLHNLSIVRNYLAHPRPFSNLSSYDHFAGYAEDLIIAVKDEDRLQRLREARDGLRKMAEGMLAEMEEREGLAELQGGAYLMGNREVWSSVHEEIFKRALRKGDLSSVHPVLRRLAERWGEANAFGR